MALTLVAGHLRDAEVSDTSILATWAMSFGNANIICLYALIRMFNKFYGDENIYKFYTGASYLVDFRG